MSELGWLRSILLVARARASGRLELSGHGRSASIAMSSGAVVAFEGDLGPRIGELIGLDRTTRPRATISTGAAAVAEGRVSRSDLAWALRRQLRLRAREIALWGVIDARWEPGPIDARAFTDPMSTCDLVSEVIRTAAESAVSADERDGRAPDRLAPGSLGAWWAERAALHPYEIAALQGEIRAPAAARFARVVRAAGLFEAPVAPEVRSLTRAHAQYRRGGASALLSGAKDVATQRRALRRIASSVHPDRFANDPALERVSHELVTALLSR